MGIMTGNHEFDTDEPAHTPLQDKLIEISNSVRDLEHSERNLSFELKEANEAIKQKDEVISQQETAILLLKQYVLENGLPAFWDPKVTTTLKKPIDQMTVGELIERNKNFANKYNKASSKETKPFPTFEEQVQMYTPKKPSPVTDLGDVIEGKEPSTAVEPGEIQSPIDEAASPFYFGEDS
jgi:hypothetical protein